MMGCKMFSERFSQAVRERLRHYRIVVIVLFFKFRAKLGHAVTDGHRKPTEEIFASS